MRSRSLSTKKEISMPVFEERTKKEKGKWCPVVYEKGKSSVWTDKEQN